MEDNSIAFFVAGSGAVFFLIEAQAGSLIRRILFSLPIFESMFACAFCTGFWVGIMSSLIHIYINDDIQNNTVIYRVVMNGMGTAITSMLLMRMIDGAEALMFCSNMLVSSLPSNDSIPMSDDDIDTDEIEVSND